MADFKDMYRKLSILEIVFCEEDHYMVSSIECAIYKELKKILGQLYCISVVIRGELTAPSRLKNFIMEIRGMGLPVSLTCIKCHNLSFLGEVKNLVSQIRIDTTGLSDFDVSLKSIYDELKTDSNNIIFLAELSSVEKSKSIFKQIESSPYIYNFTYNHSISYECYREIAGYISKFKNQYPQQLFYEFTCAGVYYDNIKGICPSRNILMCIGITGNIQYCYRDSQDHGLTIFDKDLDDLFIDLSSRVPSCHKILCNKNEYGICMGGCPIDVEGDINKYCLYK